MLPFKTRISKISKTKGKVILANDYPSSVKNLESKTINNIKKLNLYLCAIKLNFHLLLPLGLREIKKINQTAHKYNLQTIADIKLNDIGNTNEVTVENLWKSGFDAVIVNPIMGPKALQKLVKLTHKKQKGILTLCHMSAPEAKFSYDMEVTPKKTQSSRPLYQLFLKYAIEQKVDGIIVGATYPEIIRYCRKKSKTSLNIYSPGVGTQGGKVSEVLSAGSNFLIVGRTILNAKNPISMAKQLQALTLN